MKRRRPKPKPAGFWGPRVDALIRACGWPQKEWRRHFGCCPRAVNRVRYGRGQGRGRPRMEFLLRVRKLEEAYAPELEALAQGLIVTRGRMRYCWIDIPRPTRPADLQDLGVDSPSRNEAENW